MVFGNGVFGRSLGHATGTLPLRLVSLWEAVESLLLLSALCQWEHSDKVESVNQEEGPHLNPSMLAPTSDLLPPELWEINVPAFKPLSYGDLLTVNWADFKSLLREKCELH